MVYGPKYIIKNKDADMVVLRYSEDAPAGRARARAKLISLFKKGMSYKK